ncbi:MAG: DUF1566 domain-containing protein [Bacillota bacterium]
MKPIGTAFISACAFCGALWQVAAWADCDATARRSTPTAHFQFLDGGASVLDKTTGLEWRRCPEGMAFKAGASAGHRKDHCTGTASQVSPTAAKMLPRMVNAGKLGGKADWRIPTLEELQSIVEKACQLPAVNPTVFPDTPVTWFRTRDSKKLASGGEAWGIGFGMGGYYVGMNTYAAVRLVRAGKR